MEVEIERVAPGQAGTWHFAEPGGQEALRAAVVDTIAVGGQVGAFGYGVEAGEQSEALVVDQVHDVAGAFLADEFQGQQRAYGLDGWYHWRARQAGLAYDFVQADGTHQGYEEEEAAEACAKGARLQVEGADVCYRSGFGADGGWSFLVATAGQAGKALRAEQQAERINADGVPRLGELALDVIDGEVAFAQGDDAFADRIAGRAGSQPMMGHREESDAFAGVVPELVAQDAKGAWGVAKARGDFAGGELLGEVGAERFVLTLAGGVRLEEEAGGLGDR